MDAQRVLDLWQTSERAWTSSVSKDDRSNHGERVAAGFRLAKRNRRGTLTDEEPEHEHHLPLLYEDLEQSVSTRQRCADNGSFAAAPGPRIDTCCTAMRQDDSFLATVGLLDATYTAFKVPISFALPFDLSPTSASCIIDELAGIIFTLELILHFHTGIVQSNHSATTVVMNGREVAQAYITQGSFVVDLLATIPSWVEAVVLIFFPYDDRRRHVVTAITVLRLLRLLRLARFVQGVLLLSMGGRLGRKLVGRIPVTLVYLTNIVYGMAVLANLLGCLWLFTARCEGPENSWLAHVGSDEDMSDASGAAQYVTAVHFAMTTMATVGYGDIHPTNSTERLVALLIMTVGIFAFGFLLASLSELVQAASSSARRASLLHNKIKEVEHWMRQRRLPSDIRSDVTSYYADIWIPNAEAHEAELLEELPGHMRARIVKHLLQDVFTASELFSRLDVHARSMLSASLRPRAVFPGHDLCRAGDAANCMWILQTGRIVAVKDAENVDVLDAPAVLGEAALFQEDVPEAARRACTFRAQSSCMLWELQMADIQALAFICPQLHKAMLEGYRAHLAARNQTNHRQNWQRAVHTAQRHCTAPMAAGRAGVEHRHSNGGADHPMQLGGPWRGLQRVSYSRDLQYHNSPAARALAEQAANHSPGD